MNRRSDAKFDQLLRFLLRLVSARTRGNVPGKSAATKSVHFGERNVFERIPFAPSSRAILAASFSEQMECKYVRTPTFGRRNHPCDNSMHALNACITDIPP